MHAAITPSITAGLHDTLLMASFTRVFKEEMKTAMKAIAGFQRQGRRRVGTDKQALAARERKERVGCWAKRSRAGPARAKEEKGEGVVAGRQRPKARAGVGAGEERPVGLGLGLRCVWQRGIEGKAGRAGFGFGPKARERERK